MYITIVGLDGLHKTTIANAVSDLFDDVVTTPSTSARTHLSMNAPARDMMLLLDHKEAVKDISDSDDIIQDRSIVSNFGYMEGVTPAEYSIITRDIRRPDYRILIVANDADTYREYNNKIKNKDNIESLSIKRHMEIEGRMLSFVRHESMPYLIVPIRQSTQAISFIRQQLGDVAGCDKCGIVGRPLLSVAGLDICQACADTWTA